MPCLDEDWGIRKCLKLETRTVHTFKVSMSRNVSLGSGTSDQNFFNTCPDRLGDLPAPKANVPGKNARTTKIARGRIREDPVDLGILAEINGGLLKVLRVAIV